MKTRFLTLSSCFLLATLASTANAAVSYFMVFDCPSNPIKSESQVSNGLTNSVEIREYSMTLPTLQATASGVGKSQPGKATLTIKIKQDVTYANLLTAYMHKAPVGIDMVVYKSTGGPTSPAAFAKAKYQEMKITNAEITDVSLASDDESPSASITFTFQNLALDYYQQKPDGSLFLASSKSFPSLP